MSIEQVRDLAWIKSSHSGTNGGDCVEVAAHQNTVYVRDSKAVDDGAPVLRIDRAQWAAFVARVPTA
ncbi:DUF397 domain-containing protein [Streptomyces cellulosae]|jgi:hypothetical protein|uniref:DUF397 domain-containing protein n=1 Tax=Streptomyces thermodiastaticus TaxID=44061 RepID=A0ABU0KI26_9ACTN|nr:hypothetical protein [Streptomyces thermodiastaticus]MDX3413180.1 DUF397 domain-containing protein [Streptomyces sp. MD20-1-1]THC56332.1 DUF397 domain-containing protein [Streptomyces sp. Akac8]UVT12970.1 DUF397 domain-containing protein [Streptomyces thermocarboxydus]WSB44795.1 DUF397 domain-containing protein [Streptomyces cellulosae]